MERKKERPWNLRPFTIYTETPICQRFAQMISKTRSKVKFGLTIYRGSTWRIRPDHNSKELELDRNVKWYIFCSNFSVGIFFTITHDALFTSEIFRSDEAGKIVLLFTFVTEISKICVKWWTTLISVACHHDRSCHLTTSTSTSNILFTKQQINEAKC